MTDHDVAVILNLLSNKQAAAILTNLPAPRAATLAQMQPKKGGDDE
jgi:flagellar motility protein MotE (MotC chaperone)